MLGLKITDESFLEVYYDVLGKPPPSTSSKQYSHDIKAIKRLRTGDCLLNDVKSDKIRDFLLVNGYQQPTCYLYKIWVQIIEHNRLQLLRYCSEFICNPYTKSNDFYYISRWLYLFCKTQSARAVMTVEQRYIVSKFLSYNRCVDIDKLTYAANQLVENLTKLRKDFTWLTDVTLLDLINMVFDVWQDILPSMSDLSYGHLTSNSLFQVFLPNYLSSNCLVVGHEIEPEVKTTAISLEELIRLPDWRDIEDVKWENYR